MGRPYGHEYRSDGSVGTMICAGCGKPITGGEYRSYMRSKSHDWRYIIHHRECCSDDPVWAKRDAKKVSEAQDRRDLLAAAIAFRDRWKIGDLDELIDELAEASQ